MAADGEQRATLIERHSYRSPADRPPVERPIRLAVIGLGPRGRGNVVGKALTYAEYELAAVCDHRANLVAGVAETVERDHGRRVPGFTDYERMLREVEPDAVAVTTDVNVQIPIACAAMESGCHAMVEVPLCTSMEDCWRPRRARLLRVRAVRGRGAARRAGGARRLRGSRHRGAGDPGGGLDRFRQRPAGRSRLPPRTRARGGRLAGRRAAVRRRR